MTIDRAGYYLSDEITYGQPFPEGVCGCRQFRIPGIITLKNGKLFAVSDARWSDAGHDYGGIDTIFSISDDNGKTWHPGFAAMFPDSDGTPDNPHDVTTCIDPCVVQDGNGRIHIFVNINPTGTTTGLEWPETGNGFIEIDGKMRLGLTYDFNDSKCDFSSLSGDKLLYVGDYSNGYAPVIRADGTETKYTVDKYFNLYCSGSPIYQKQVNTDKEIVQNVFYRDSEFHVFKTMFTFHLFTDDEGKTWDTEIISDRIKLQSEDALISSPGNGLLTSDNVILMPFYALVDDYKASAIIIYSTDNGISWNRTPFVPVTENVNSSSEGKIVEINTNVWRLFVRNQMGYICYADYIRDRNEWLDPVKTDIKIHSDCNFSAVKYDGKIYASYPEGEGPESNGRVNGRLYTFKIENDNSITLIDKKSITDKAFSYSCLTADIMGVKVLYDTCEDGIEIFMNI